MTKVIGKLESVRFRLPFSIRDILGVSGIEGAIPNPKPKEGLGPGQPPPKQGLHARRQRAENVRLQRRGNAIA